KPLPEASLWNVPHERNPVFTGRSETLDALRADLLRDGRQALYGLGGIGKTQIAAEYAFRHRQNHNAIFWVFADSEQSIGIDYVRIAKLLNLPSQDLPDQNVIIGGVKRWLDQNDGWLLIFDNVEDPKDLQGFLPKECPGHILLTSRAPVFQALSILRPVEVEVLPPAAATE